MRIRMMIGLFIGVGIFGGCLEDGRYDAMLGKESMDFKRLIRSSNRVILIRSIADLEVVRSNLGGYYVVGRELDLRSIKNFKPIGDEKAPFIGVFDGNGKKIKNLEINRGSEDNIGFFGVLGEEAVVKNVILEDVDINGDNGVGGLVGYNDGGVIEDSYATGIVEGKMLIGGFVGYNDGGVIRDSYAASIVEGKMLIGGFVGYNDGGGVIEKSYALGDVEGRDVVGGFAGMSGEAIRADIVNEKIKIKESYATGKVKGERIVGGFMGFNLRAVIEESRAAGKVEGIGNDHWIGGFVGWNYGRIEESYATGGVKSRVNIAGGFVGLNVDMIKRSYATGDVEGGNNVGGFVGWNGSVELNLLEGVIGRHLWFLKDKKDKNDQTLIIGGTGGVIEKSYATGKVEGKQMIGGLVGYFNDGKIKRSYATGQVKGNGNVGGFVGWRFKGRIIGKNYWKVGSATEGVGRGSGGNVFKKTDVGFKALDAVATGWDTTIWDFQAGKYPKLSWQK